MENQLAGDVIHISTNELSTSFATNSPLTVEQPPVFAGSVKLRGDEPYDERLQQYADLISGALGKKPLENDIICVRRTNVNPFDGCKKEDVLTIPQFFSTSLFEEAALSGDYEITLFINKGVKGAFLDERVSRHPEQLEFLLDKNCNYIVKLIEGKNIVVEVIP